MKHLVIGTAGHVDHGKTCLTKALTGVDTDRLKEEQKRGITIEIGFAQLVLPNGQTASIVDVPGHERLIHNMLVGATGIDVVMLVVAADEGFMPQTREHLDILTLLNVKNGIIVLTKSDMADEEWLETVMEDTREQVRGSFLENAPMIPVSAYTGAGLEELKQKIVELVENSPARAADKPFRLPVDRVFSIKGFGTVVTGTLIDGVMRSGDEAMVYPEMLETRARELQNHDVKVESVEAGMRVAINLAGIDKKDIERGCIIAQPGTMFQTNQITVEVELTETSPYRVKNHSFLHFYQGTQEKVCKIRFLDRSELKPGEKTYAQISFKDDTIVARNLDRFIIRFFSPMVTVGGGTILDMKERHIKLNSEEEFVRLDRLNSTPVNRVFQMIEDSEYGLIKEAELANQSGLSAKAVHAAIQELQQMGVTLKIQGGYITRKTLENLEETATEILKKHHEAQSLMEGMSLSELRTRLFKYYPKTADAILGHLKEKGKLRIVGSSVSLPSFQTEYTPEQIKIQSEIEEYYLRCGIEPPLNADVAESFGDRAKLCRQVTARMVKDGILVALNPTVTCHGTACKKALDTFTGMFADSDTVALADFRTKMGISRKYAQYFLDYFDSVKISKLVGDRRVLLKK